MVKSGAFVLRIGLFCCVIFLCQRKSLASTTNTTKKSTSKRQTDSFVVSANYGVQSGNTNSQYRPSESARSYQPLPNSYDQFERPPQTSTNTTSHQSADPQKEFYTENSLIYTSEHLSEVLPTPSAWIGSNLQSFTADDRFDGHERHLEHDPLIYVTNTYPNYGAHGDVSATAHPYSSDNNHMRSFSLTDEHFESSPQYQRTPHESNISADKVSEDIVYGTISTSIPNTQWHSSASDDNVHQQLRSRADEVISSSSYDERGDISGDSHKPSVQELQQIIGKIVKGATKVHQVVKVPAVYEIHLQEEEKPLSGTLIHDVIKNFQVPLPEWHAFPHQAVHQSPDVWTQQQHYSPQQIWHQPSNAGGNKKPTEAWTVSSSSQAQQPSWPKYQAPRTPRPWKKPQYLRGSRLHTTKTWNLPTKIKYFNNKPVSTRPIESSGPSVYNGKYSYPKPFAPNTKWASSVDSNTIPLDSWKYSTPSPHLQSGHSYYGSVSIPMTPGSTAVTFLDHKSNNNALDNHINQQVYQNQYSSLDNQNSNHINQQVYQNQYSSLDNQNSNHINQQVDQNQYSTLDNHENSIYHNAQQDTTQNHIQGGTFNQQSQFGTPDLSLYYAKKKQLENDGYRSSQSISNAGYRRSDNFGSRADKVRYGSQMKRSHRMQSPFGGMNYIIHVREKS